MKLHRSQVGARRGTQACGAREAHAPSARERRGLNGGKGAGSAANKRRSADAGTRLVGGFCAAAEAGVAPEVGAHDVFELAVAVQLDLPAEDVSLADALLAVEEEAGELLLGTLAGLAVIDAALLRLGAAERLGVVHHEADVSGGISIVPAHVIIVAEAAAALIIGVGAVEQIAVVGAHGSALDIEGRRLGARERKVGNAEQRGLLRGAAGDGQEADAGGEHEEALHVSIEYRKGSFVKHNRRRRRCRRTCVPQFCSKGSAERAGSLKVSRQEQSQNITPWTYDLPGDIRFGEGKSKPLLFSLIVAMQGESSARSQTLGQVWTSVHPLFAGYFYVSFRRTPYG